MNIKINILKNFENNLKEIIKDIDYSTATLFLELVKDYEMDYAGMYYGNQLYKDINELEKLRSSKNDTISDEKILEHEKVAYFLYKYTHVGNILLNFKQFIIFSKLVCATFANYNPNKIRDKDDNIYMGTNNTFDNAEEPYKNIEGYVDTMKIVNAISYNYRHNEHPHAFEIDETRLDLLKDVLREKLNELDVVEIKNINIDEYMDYIKKRNIGWHKEKINNKIKKLGTNKD